MHLITIGLFVLGGIVLGLLTFKSGDSQSQRKVHKSNLKTTEKVKAFCIDVRQVAPHLNEKSLHVIAQKCREGDTQRIMDHLASPIMQDNDQLFTVHGTCEHLRRQPAGNYSQEFKDSMKTILEMCDRKVTAESRIELYMAYVRMHAVQRNDHMSMFKAELFCKDVSLMWQLGLRCEVYQMLRHFCSEPAGVQRTTDIEEYLNSVTYSQLPDTPSPIIARMCNGILEGEELEPDLETLPQYTLTIDSDGKKLLRNFMIGLQELCDMKIKSRATKFKIVMRTTSITLIYTPEYLN